MTQDAKGWRFATRAVHVGVDKDPSFHSVTTPIYPSSTFRRERLDKEPAYEYTRSGNPTRSALSENLCALEGGAAACCTATGMAAASAVLHLLGTGAHVVAGRDLYGGTYRVMTGVFEAMGLTFSFVDTRDPAKVAQAFRPETRMLWIETPSNPLLQLTDLEAVSRLARERDILTVVDNTFMSPFFQRPLALGADIVVHSTTKYINGHSDVVGGAVVCRDVALGEKVGYRVNALGVSEAPFDAWLVLRGIKTLALRMERHAANAQRVAAFLEGHPAVRRVRYPGLPSHPQHALACRQMSGFGGMVTVELDTERVPLDTFFGRLRVFTLAESLGGVESLIESPWFMTHASMPEDARREAGITPGTVRLSVGVEDADDLVEDLQAALRG